ncbi:hypothetical protein ACFQV2_07545 [Actinokineospora soli]|uniref:NlpC/P60 family protein n=1 Tax=Actinokineospora soli TaxID=1048753 RepID=A0ABW2TKC9_9PSEU
MKLSDREAHEFAKIGSTVPAPAPGDLVFYDHEDDGEYDHVAVYLGVRKADPTGPAYVVEAYGKEGYTAPEHLVRVREYTAGDLVKRPFTLQPAPNLTAQTVADGSVRFTWPDSDGEAGYQLTSGTNPITIAADRTSHTVSGLPWTPRPATASALSRAATATRRRSPTGAPSPAPGPGPSPRPRPR